MNRSRAWRRHQRHRIKRKRGKVISRWFNYTANPDVLKHHLNKRTNTCTPCSCAMCGNPRKYASGMEALTKQERKAMYDEKEQTSPHVIEAAVSGFFEGLEQEDDDKVTDRYCTSAADMQPQGAIVSELSHDTLGALWAALALFVHGIKKDYTPDMMTEAEQLYYEIVKEAHKRRGNYGSI